MAGLIQWFDSVASTMDEARGVALAGAAHGTVVAARVQRAGRGRAGRAWASPPGNLHATVVLRPAAAARQAPELGFVAGVAVAEAVDALAGGRSALKWPNDLLRDGAKLAGLLLERMDDGAVLLGLGVNVAHVPPGLAYPATSLAAQGCPASAAELLDAVMERLLPGVTAWQASGFAPVLDRWRQRGPALGAVLSVRLGDRHVEGRFAGLAPNGAMLLDTAGGRHTIVAGDVVAAAGLRPPPPSPTSAPC